MPHSSNHEPSFSAVDVGFYIAKKTTTEQRHLDLFQILLSDGLGNPSEEDARPLLDLGYYWSIQNSLLEFVSLGWGLRLNQSQDKQSLGLPSYSSDFQNLHLLKRIIAVVVEYVSSGANLADSLSAETSLSSETIKCLEQYARSIEVHFGVPRSSHSPLSEDAYAKLHDEFRKVLLRKLQEYLSDWQSCNTIRAFELALQETKEKIDGAMDHETYSSLYGMRLHRVTETIKGRALTTEVTPQRPRAASKASKRSLKNNPSSFSNHSKKVALIQNHSPDQMLADLNEIAKKLDPNVRDHQGNTLLHHVAFCKNKKLAKMLFDKGARLDLENNKGQLAFETKKQKKWLNLHFPDAVRMLEYQQSELTTAIHSGSRSSVSRFILKGWMTRKNLVDQRGNTAFHLLAKAPAIIDESYVREIKAVNREATRLGYDFNQQDHEGKTVKDLLLDTVRREKANLAELNARAQKVEGMFKVILTYLNRQLDNHSKQRDMIERKLQPIYRAMQDICAGKVPEQIIRDLQANQEISATRGFFGWFGVSKTSQLLKGIDSTVFVSSSGARAVQAIDDQGMDLVALAEEALKLRRQYLETERSLKREQLVKRLLAPVVAHIEFQQILIQALDPVNYQNNLGYRILQARLVAIQTMQESMLSGTGLQSGLEQLIVDPKIGKKRDFAFFTSRTKSVKLLEASRDKARRFSEELGESSAVHVSCKRPRSG